MQLKIDQSVLSGCKHGTKSVTIHIASNSATITLVLKFVLIIHKIKAFYIPLAKLVQRVKKMITLKEFFAQGKNKYKKEAFTVLKCGFNTFHS